MTADGISRPEPLKTDMTVGVIASWYQVARL
jgi:hypothetical protein